MMLRPFVSVSSACVFVLRLSVIIAPVAILGACRGVSDRSIENMTGLELRRLVDQASKDRNAATLVLIDPRHPREYVAGRIPGAQNLRLSDVPPDARVDPALARFETVVVYGNDPSSAAARAMTKRLLAIGYSGVRFFPGGLEEWRSLGGEVEAAK
ncbi:MAG: hypothetical protein HBSAPP03_03920 [Phycisphaerae bacterium]|nr:MAG: hypothetical protein HBSAPP03_03920 [Phycisphaerae bacterium]